jgi:hypothetical protein
MSKGLSKYQNAILARLEKDGGLGVFDVAIEIAICKTLDNMTGSERYSNEINDITKSRYASDIKNVSAAYRMMRSLEKRGLVAKVIGTRGWWIPVKMDIDKLNLGDGIALPERLNKKLDKGMPLSLRTKDRIWGT